MKANEAGGQSRIVAITSWTLLVVLLTIILKKLDFLFIPLSVSLLLCYALGIPLDYMKRLKMPSFLRIIVIVLCMLGILYLLGRLVSHNVQQFQANLPGYEEKFWSYSSSLLNRLDLTHEQIKEVYASFLMNFKQAGFAPLGKMVGRAGDSFFSFLGNLVWVLLFMVFILAERENLSRRLVKALGEKQAVPFHEAVAAINHAVQHYLGLKTFVSILTGTLVALVLWIAGIDFALMWGVLAFLLNYIPNIGSFVATIPPVAVALFQYGSPLRAFVVALLLTAVQMIVANVVEPKLMGKGLDLSPLVVLVSLLFWGWMWGITGMLLSVPLTAAVKIALQQMERTRSVAVLLSGK